MNFEFKNKLDQNPQVRKHLFEKGFLITNGEVPDLNVFPFYGNWRSAKYAGYNFIIHNECPSFFLCKNDITYFLIGYAFNPWDFTLNENEILEKVSRMNGSEVWKYEADLTGIYVLGKIGKDGTIYHWSDCAGMRISYYGHINGKYYIGSHANLLAYLCNLKEETYITELKSSKTFHLFGAVLPGDLSPYAELKRTVPNHIYGSDDSCKRFFPITSLVECETEEEYQEVLKESAHILRQTLLACSEKFKGKQCAISVTGGKDSGETLASANGIYDRFQYFSYISKVEESVDASAAAKICKSLGIRHRIINIPNDDSASENLKLLNEVIYCNSGYVGYPRANEIRKRDYLITDNSYDIEIKSWVNEIVRAYWYKKYAKEKFPGIPTGKYLATLYKIFIFNRLTFHKTANVFETYRKKYMTEQDIERIGDWTILWSWEFGFSASEGLHLFAEHMLSFDIVIPFNNRHLIALMLKPKLKDRISDRLQKDIIRVNNSAQANLNISVTNAAHTSKRAFLERVYLFINTHLPF